jgi:hypothetical protein
MRKSYILIGIFLLTTILLCQPVMASGNYADEVVAESYCTNSDEALGAEDGTHATLGVNNPTQRIGSFVLEFSGNIPGNSYLWIHANSTLQEYYGWRLLGTLGTESDWTWNCSDTTTTRFTTPGEPSPVEDWEAIEIATQEQTMPTPDANDPIYGSEIDAVEF